MKGQNSSDSGSRWRDYFVHFAHDEALVVLSFSGQVRSFTKFQVADASGKGSQGYHSRGGFRDDRDLVCDRVLSVHSCASRDNSYAV